MAGQPVETPAAEGAPEVSKKGAKKAAAAAAKAAEKAKKVCFGGVEEAATYHNPLLHNIALEEHALTVPGC